MKRVKIKYKQSIKIVYVPFTYGAEKTKEYAAKVFLSVESLQVKNIKEILIVK